MTSHDSSTNGLINYIKNTPPSNAGLEGMSARAQLFVFKLQLAMGNVMYEIFMNLQRKSQNNCLEHCSIYLNGVTARPCTSLRPCCLHVQFTFGTSVEWCFEASGRSKGTRHRNFSASFYIFIDRLQEDTIIYKQTRQLDIILATLLKLTRSGKLQRISCEIKIK